MGTNGNGNTDYITINLSGSTNSNGFFLINQDLQNGPDAVRLESTTPAIILGRLGYDTAPIELNPPLYETLPAPEVNDGHCLTRNPTHSDTDNNSMDFTDSSSPTPGS